MLDNMSTDVSSEKVQEHIDNYTELLNNAIHSAAKESGCVSNNRNIPKCYWFPLLSQLSDKKRFWWRIWLQCGRPIQELYLIATKM